MPVQRGSIKLKRGQKYDCLDCYELFKIPIRKLLSKFGYLGVWVTNHMKYHRFIREKYAPDLGLEVACKLIWVKITTNGDLMVSIDSSHRKTYEILYILKKKSNPISIKDQFHVSVPSMHHSHKPNIEYLIEQYVGKDARKLELFGRFVRQGWYCWGNEPIYFNDSLFYE